jgi:Xaa-Pro aminopeptidase
MTTYLLHGDSVHGLELRHEIGEPIMDPITFIEHDERRIAVVSDLEEPILGKREDVIDDLWNVEDFGFSDLLKDRSVPEHLVEPEIVLRVLQKLGVARVSVPSGFGALLLDYLRGKGIEVTVEPVVWADRRRRKTPWELEGIERAQRAAETAMLSAARMLREAEPTNDGRLRF